MKQQKTHVAIIFFIIFWQILATFQPDWEKVFVF